MKQKNFLKIPLLFFFLSTTISFSQVVINNLYSENFFNQNDKGVTGPDTSNIDLSGVDWTIDVDQVNLIDSEDWVKVRFGRLEARNISGEAIWKSPEIDISGHVNVSFSLLAGERGTMETNDTFITEYSIDDGDWIEATTNGNLNGEFYSEIVSQNGLNGNKLEIRVRMRNANGGYETHILDNILVEGTEVNSPNDTFVTFETPSTGINETVNTQTISIPITLTNYSGQIVTVQPSVNSSSTANSNNYSFNSTTSLSFNNDETKVLSLNIATDDANFIDETIIIDLEVTSNDENGNENAEVVIDQFTITISDDDAPLIVISEISYNSNDRNSENRSIDDEWIEIYNASGSEVDISGWTIENTSNTFGSPFIFPTNTILANNTFTTIALGSDGLAEFNNDNPFTPNLSNIKDENGQIVLVQDVASTNDTNHLDNGSSTFFLKKLDGGIVDQVKYIDRDLGSRTGAYHDGGRLTLELINPTIDNSLTSSNWQISGLGGSPGEERATHWTGNNDNNWSNPNNWSPIGIPNSSANIVIPEGLTNYPTISSNSSITVNKLLITSGSTLIVEESSSLSGEITYQRFLSATQWYFMTSPVVGEVYGDYNNYNPENESETNHYNWVSTNSIASGQNQNKGISTYDNSSKDPATDHWRYLQSNDNSNAKFYVGQGYGIIKSYTGTVSFTGPEIYNGTTNDPQNENFTLSQPNSNKNDNESNNFNLIGNPFTAYLTIGSIYNSNSTRIGTEFYFWENDSYITRLSGLDANYKIPPGQAFFVEAIANNESLTFNSNDVTHEGTDNFQKTTSEIPEIILNISEGNKNRNAKIYYINGTSKGYDAGYDGKLFDGEEDSFSIFYDLIESDGYKYQIQSLPNQEYEKTVIPVGVIANANKEITFTAETLNLPAGLKVYLEDREYNIITRLDEENTNYTVSLNNSLKGTGRFYLHTKSSALNTDNINLEGISIFTTDKNTLRVLGINSTDASIKIYNVLGKEVVNRSFSSKGATSIDLPNLSSGIYIIQIATEKGKATKKIMLK